ncbi:MAG: DUF1080 domain-containing protein [Lentisphaeraceae bacterium]|nr:DUF1080 domain-containing protein [Lentisphaeraceae bacterium]
MLKEKDMFYFMLILFITFTPSCVVKNIKNKEINLIKANSLENWQGNSSNWSVEDGVITGVSTSSEPLKQNTFLIWEHDLPENFELNFKYRFKSKSGNSGIQYNSKVLDKEKFIVAGMQADFETGDKYSGILYEERGRGILAQRGKSVTVDEKGQKIEVGNLQVPTGIDKSTKEDGWQTYKVVFLNNKATHIINGYATSITEMKSFVTKAYGRTLALQLHKGPPMKIQFKGLTLKELNFCSEKSLQKYNTEISSSVKNLHN